MNSINIDLPDYDQANAAMEAAGFESSAAEVHGTICGVLASPEAEKTDWLAAIMGTDSGNAEGLPKTVSEQLLALFQGSRKVLKDESSSFALFVPEADKNSIATRTDAVAAWCRGFLLGLSAGGLKEFATLPDSIREALEDLLDIAEVVAEEGEDEQQEQALSDLEEYVRVVVQLIYDDRRDEAQ
jgi:yecA family protein